MRNWKKFSILTLGTLSILGTTVFATTGIVNAPNGLVFRKEPSSSAEVITTLPDDAELDIIDNSGEWYKVIYDSKEGYVFGQYVEIKKEQETTPSDNTVPNNETTSTRSQLKVYNIPVITSTVINVIEPNAEIKVEKEITNWSYVVSGDIRGWVRTYGLNNKTAEEKTTEETNQNEPENPEETPSTETIADEETSNNTQNPADNSNMQETSVDNVKGYIAVDCANVRNKPSTNSEIVTALTKDTSFKIVGETEEWYKIVYTSPSDEKYEGYIAKSLVTK